MMTKLNPTTEYQEHIAFVKWFELSYPKYKHLLIHIPNGELRDKRTGAKLKKMGVRKGLPDFFLAVTLKKFALNDFDYRSGLWIELKSKKGKLMIDQATYLSELSKSGYSACVAYGWEDAANYVISYFDNSTKMWI